MIALIGDIAPDDGGGGLCAANSGEDGWSSRVRDVCAFGMQEHQR